MVLELLDVPALLAALQSFRPRIVEQVNPLGAADTPVEVICPNGILQLISRKPESQAEVVRDEGTAHVACRENPFAHGEHNYVPEVECAGLERPHHLEAAERLSLERHGFQGRQAGQQPEPCPLFQGVEVKPDTGKALDGLAVTVKELPFELRLLRLQDLDEFKQVGCQRGCPGHRDEEFAEEVTV